MIGDILSDELLCLDIRPIYLDSPGNINYTFFSNFLIVNKPDFTVITACLQFSNKPDFVNFLLRREGQL